MVDAHESLGPWDRAQNLNDSPEHRQMVHDAMARFLGASIWFVVMARREGYPLEVLMASADRDAAYHYATRVRESVAEGKADFDLVTVAGIVKGPDDG
jgi:hypothetical protein